MQPHYFHLQEHFKPDVVRKLEMVLISLLKRLIDHASFKPQNHFAISIFSKNTHWQSLPIIITMYPKQFVLKQFILNQQLVYSQRNAFQLALMCMICDGPQLMRSTVSGLQSHEVGKPGPKWAVTFLLFLSSLIVDVLCCSEQSANDNISLLKSVR